MIINEETYIEHVGVVGMRWGTRGGRSAQSKSKREEKKQKWLNRSFKQKLAVNVASLGAAFVTARFLGRQGGTQITRIAGAVAADQATRRVSTALLDRFGNRPVSELSK
jgi:hypothetical protein